MGAITNVLCEKAGFVTAVDLSRQRTSAIIERCNALSQSLRINSWKF